MIYQLIVLAILILGIAASFFSALVPILEISVALAIAICLVIVVIWVAQTGRVHRLIEQTEAGDVWTSDLEIKKYWIIAVTFDDTRPRWPYPKYKVSFETSLMSFQNPNSYSEVIDEEWFEIVRHSNLKFWGVWGLDRQGRKMAVKQQS